MGATSPGPLSFSFALSSSGSSWGGRIFIYRVAVNTDLFYYSRHKVYPSISSPESNGTVLLRSGDDMYWLLSECTSWASLVGRGCWKREFLRTFRSLNCPLCTRHMLTYDGVDETFIFTNYLPFPLFPE